MKSAPLPATPDMMTLFCLISGAMREAGPSGLWLHLLLVGALSPNFGMLLKTWMVVQEHFAAETEWDDAQARDDGDGQDGDGLGSGWLCREGPVWRWRHVTRFGSVLVIPYRWFVAFRRAASLKRRRVWAPSWLLVAPPAKIFFLPALANR